MMGAVSRAAIAEMISHRVLVVFIRYVACQPNGELSRSRRRLGTDEAGEQQIYRPLRQRRGWRLSAQVKSSASWFAFDIPDNSRLSLTPEIGIG